MKSLVITTTIMVFCLPAISRSATAVETHGLFSRMCNITEGTKCQSFGTSDIKTEKHRLQAPGHRRFKQAKSAPLPREVLLAGKYGYQESQIDKTQRYLRPITNRFSESMKFFANTPASTYASISSRREKVCCQLSQGFGKSEAVIMQHGSHSQEILLSSARGFMPTPIIGHRSQLIPYMSNTEWGPNGKIRKVARRLTPDIFARFE